MDRQRLTDFYRNKKVLITGHTGFKGAWLSHVLLEFGAHVVGVSLPPQTPDDIFVRTKVKDRITHYELDIRKEDAVRTLFKTESPDIVFHLAAQALVRRSYNEPALTVSTNVGGTTNVLEAIRHCPSIQSAVIITTDKVYENKEWVYGYRETDMLGGRDLYSGSKAAADVVTKAYRETFFNPDEYKRTHTTLVGTARAGNVIGGGDWSLDRLVPDIMRAVFYENGTVTLRYPEAVRPWEHVLEPISGYLLLGARLAEGEKGFSGAWNFGPDQSAWLTVEEMTTRILSHLGSGSLAIESQGNHAHESTLLTLDTTKAQRQLGWKSQWDIDTTLRETARWYRAVHDDPQSAEHITREQIAAYFNSDLHV